MGWSGRVAGPLVRTRGRAAGGLDTCRPWAGRGLAAGRATCVRAGRGRAVGTACGVTFGRGRGVTRATGLGRGAGFGVTRATGFGLGLGVTRTTGFGLGLGVTEGLGLGVSLGRGLTKRTSTRGRTGGRWRGGLACSQAEKSGTMTSRFKTTEKSSQRQLKESSRESR
ncbi:MAG: hypothetical protein AMXMBFR33_63700 [Candidatus Xenobia bacterium]